MPRDELRRTLLQLVPTFTRAIRLNATEGVVEVAASVAGPNGTVATKLTVELEEVAPRFHLMLPLPGEALWGALSANDKMAVENGSHVAAVLRVFNGEEDRLRGLRRPAWRRAEAPPPRIPTASPLVRANRLYDNDRRVEAEQRAGAHAAHDRQTKNGRAPEALPRAVARDGQAALPVRRGRAVRL